jgi:hypothetical protein
MTRYHFHICDGRSFNDYRGTRLADLKDAKLHAEGLADIIADGQRRPDPDMYIKVTDDDGVEVLKLQVNH